jgi:hypothetical protein
MSLQHCRNRLLRVSFGAVVLLFSWAVNLRWVTKWGVAGERQINPRNVAGTVYKGSGLHDWSCKMRRVVDTKAVLQGTMRVGWITTFFGSAGLGGLMPAFRVLCSGTVANPHWCDLGRSMFVTEISWRFLENYIVILHHNWGQLYSVINSRMMGCIAQEDLSPKIEYQLTWVVILRFRFRMRHGRRRRDRRPVEYTASFKHSRHIDLDRELLNRVDKVKNRKENMRI